MPAADTSTDILIPNSRILYVDPNDIFGKINGVPVTPDYSDFCISFNLECEIVARYKTNEIIGVSDNGNYGIGFTQKMGVGDNHWASLLQGEAIGKDEEHFLTTYYTDINYDNFKKETVVEGLGVENVSISFEGYYTPTVTIKFVDHRGAALFGREEATHFNDKLTIDNIFGAFFTIPYPKFRLQVKGFLGKAVTYQLSCVSFKGSLNSQTGNFEAIATFVGYNYSLLTDIPFEYLVAAPYCEYFGKDYWEEKKSQEEWRLEGNYEGDDTPTFYELIQRIEAAFTNEGLLQVISDEEKKELDTANDEVAILDTISELYNGFLNSIDEKVLHPDSKIRNYEPDNPVENAQILFMADNTAMGEWSTPKTLWEYVTKTIEEYNGIYTDNPIPEDVLPKPPHFESVVFTPFFIRTKDSSGNIDITFKNIKQSTVENLTKISINDNQITESLAKAIIDFMNKQHSKNNILPNVYLLDCGSLSLWLKERTSELKTKVTEINNNKERNYIDLAINNLGMVPYIGNVFKLIMCHIETFLHMMLQCYNNIKTATRVGQRTLQYLNVYSTHLFENKLSVSLASSELNPVNVPPWPAVSSIRHDDDKYSAVEKNDVYGWVGDFSPYFEEAKLVRSLYLACKRTAKEPPSSEDTEAPVNILYLPIIPNDVNNNLNPFNGGGKDISSMAGMLGLRAAQIFGIGESAGVDDNIAKTIGKMDALNYYRFIGTKEDLTNILEQKPDNLANVLYDIMLCKADADKYGTVDETTNEASQKFEFAKGVFADKLSQKGRHPIYNENNNQLNYTYLFTKSHYALVPANTLNWDKYPTRFKPTGDEKNRYFEFQIKTETGSYIADSFMHKCSSLQLLTDFGTEEKTNHYVNNEMYAIITKPSLVKGIMKRYDEMLEGTVNVLGEKFKLDMTKVLDRYWRVSKKERYKYMSKKYGFFAKSFKDTGIDDKLLLTNNRPDASSYVSDTYDKITKTGRYCFFENDELKDINGKVVDINSVVVPQLFIRVDGSTHSLFGHSFYYQQNSIKDADIRDRVKALLFLRALPYDYDKVMYWDSDNIKHSTIVRMPFGFVALYGALLWRHNYIKENGVDPIICGNYKPFYNKETKLEYDIVTPSKNGSVSTGIISSGSNETYKHTVFKQGDSKKYMFSREPDYIVANEMLRAFDGFMARHWKIISQLELTKSGGGSFSGQEFNAHIEGLCNKYAEAMKSAQENAQNTANAMAVIDESINPEGVDGTIQPTEEQKPENAPIDQEELKKERMSASAAAMKDAVASFNSFTVNYCFMWYYFRNEKHRLSLWLNTSNKKVQSALRAVYMDECIELRTGSWTYRSNNNSNPGVFTDITVNPTNMKSYLSGFAEQLDAIVGNTNNDFDIGGEDETVVEATKEFNRDVALPIYLYLKMLWDKWLVSIDLNDHEFMVKHFNDNFIFIDSFYRNIENRFMLNCQTILDCYNNNVTSNSDITVFKFIGDITTRHHCMFVAVPDFISNWASEDSTEAAEALISIFTPIPYLEKSKSEEHNKFVTIYVPKLSESPSELNNFRDDGFNIWSYNDVRKSDLSTDNQTETLPSVLCNIENFDWDKQGDLTRYGYYVPSFGLTYGRQNNHIFKNINLSMDTPIITSTVINTLSHISREGSNNTHRVAYIGQDIYPVFSNYSYICEFEMMGCAQIQPLMYFQLMNVPMWRGTYIIFSVTHTMTPGNMVTRVKAMKLSNRAVPYSNAWFTENPNFDPEALRKLQCLEDLLTGKLNINVGSIGNGQPVSEQNNSDGEAPSVGEGSLSSVEGRAKYIYNYFKNKGVPLNSILGIMANLHRNTGGMVFPYNKWQVDCHQQNNKCVRTDAGGGLRGELASGTRKIAKTYNVGNNALVVIDKAENFAKSYPLSDALSNKSAKDINAAVPEGYPIPIDIQLLDIYDSIKNSELMKNNMTPEECSTYFRNKINNPGRGKKDPTDGGRWKRHGEDIKKWLGI